MQPLEMSICAHTADQVAQINYIALCLGRISIIFVTVARKRAFPNRPVGIGR
jgi:hypothetical protein